MKLQIHTITQQTHFCCVDVGDVHQRLGMSGEGHLDGCSSIDENKRNQSTELTEYHFFKHDDDGNTEATPRDRNCYLRIRLW